MHWQLDPQASFCIASGRAVFLHAANDRYLALPEPLNQTLIDWLDAPGIDLPHALVDTLRSAGILVPSTHKGSHPIMAFTCQVAEQALQREPRERIGLVELTAVAATFWRTKCALHRLGFAGLIGRLPTPGEPTTARADAEPHARRFLRAQALLPVNEDCLVNSIALLDYLRRRGCDAQAVFGVTAIPFQAHCWVQARGVLLNDAPDNVSAFTPILVR